jgi:A/G-specific adenine glycosylase
LKGVGEYTAAAIASFSYNEVVPLWTECVLVLSRYFDVETDIALASAKRVCSFGFQLMPKDNPAFNRRLWSSVLCNAYLKSKLWCLRV